MSNIDTVYQENRALEAEVERLEEQINAAVKRANEIDKVGIHEGAGWSVLNKLNIHRCDSCEGVGVGVSEICTDCNGRGWTKEPDTEYIQCEGGGDPGETFDRLAPDEGWPNYSKEWVAGWQVGYGEGEMSTVDEEE